MSVPFASVLLSVAAFANAGGWLEPLTAEEIAATGSVLSKSRDFPKGAFFAQVNLLEPAKEQAWSAAISSSAASRPPRRAFAIVFDRPNNKTFEAVVDLNGQKVESWKRVPGAQPPVLLEEYGSVQDIVREDAAFQAAVRRRGIDPKDVLIEAWAAGHVLPEGLPAARLLRAVCYLRARSENYYGRPIEGLIPIVDMTHRKVVRLDDSSNTPVPSINRELDQPSPSSRPAAKPLTISQPQGDGIEVDGHSVRWQNWSFLFSLHPRDGLVLQTVAYEDGGRARPILYRASLSETVVPYGDPDPVWSWRNAFDEGEYGLGRLTSPLEPGVDAPANARLFDSVFADDAGKPYVAKNSIALYERDGGILWKHFNLYTQKNDARRARQLVLMSAVAIGNYDYVFSWIFGQDGALELDAMATGIMLPKAAGASASGDHGHHVSREIIAPHHQHFLNFRLDFDVDGAANSVSEVDAEPMPAGANNALKTGIVMRETALGDESAARRDLSLERARKWRVSGPRGGYLLVPETNALPLASPDSALRRRAAFLDHPFWATRYHAGELYAAGDYPNQSKSPGGLPDYSNGEPLENQDVVLWYTVGITHIPRPEEWPVMPAAHFGFKLLPAGFFAENPAMDLPAATIPASTKR